MIAKPRPFIIPQKPFPKTVARRETRRHRMTLVSALIGREGVAFFCDTQETHGGYAKKNVDKMTVWDLDDSPFRFAISGATDDATYLEMLERAITASVVRLDAYDLTEIEKVIADTLAEFYAKHIWPQAAKAPLMEFLMVFQPLPSGMPEVFHVSGTAVNVPSLAVHYKSIGIGAYMADYLFSFLLEGDQTQMDLAIAASHVGKQVNENVDGCGPVERIVLLGRNGEYEELGSDEINDSLKIMQPIIEVFGKSFASVCNIDRKNFDMTVDYLAAELNDIRESSKAWWASIQAKINQIAEHGTKSEPKKNSS